MSRWESWTLRLANGLVIATGLVYALFLYGVRPADPYAVVNHPLQPLAQHLHVLAAPWLLFAAGLIWSRHVWTHWRSGVPFRRRSGVTLGLALAPMAVSGYLLQVSVGEGWRQAWTVVHLTTSGLWCLGFMLHQLPGWRLRWLRWRSPGGA